MTRPPPGRRRTLGLSVGLALLVLLPLMAWSALGPGYGGELVVGLSELPASLEPGVPGGLGDALVAGLVHETLLDTGPDGVPAPRLARSFSSGASGREWTLRLAEGTTFHDGKALTAADVVRSVRRFLRSPSPAAQRLAETLEGATAFRSRTSDECPGLIAAGQDRVTLRLAGAVPLPLAPLAAPAAAITSAAGAGAGPFVPTSVLPGKSRGLVAFTGHVEGRPYLDVIRLIHVSDGSLDAALRAGRVGLVPKAGKGVQGGVLAGTLLLVLDPMVPPFDRAESRSAVAAAIDGADLVRHLMPGADPAPSLVSPLLLPPLGLAIPSPRARLRGTARLAVSRDVPPIVSQRIVAYLIECGLEVRVEAVAPGAARQTGPALRLLLVAPEVAEPGLALREVSTLAAPVAGAQEPLRAVEAELGLDRRRAHLHRAEAALRSSHTLIPIATLPISWQSRPGLHGVSVTACGRVVLENAWLEP